MKLIDLENKYENKDCVILSCGPSLREYSKEKVKEFCKNKVVICVKEAVFEYEDIADYCIYNACRKRNYSIRKDIIKIFSGTIKNGDCHLFLKEDGDFNESRQLLKTHVFDKYNFHNNTTRHWGPGIMYEVVFYLCLYMGINNVYTFGWDLIDTSSTSLVEHFFENDQTEEYKKSHRFGNRDFKKEMIVVNKNIPYMYEYFKSKNMFIYVVGEQSFVNRDIPRIFL